MVKTSMRELSRIAQHDPTVDSILTMWRKGEFATFEEALIFLAVTLAEQKHELECRVTVQMAGNLPPIVPKGGA